MARLVSFDIAKALCIILVVIGHYFPIDSPQWYATFRSWIYSFHMPLFMFASGYIYMAFKRDESYTSFLMKKFRRLMVPYFVVSAIIVSVKMATQSSMYVENPVTAMSYVKILYLPEAGYFLWFIWALFTMFLLVPLFKTKIARLVLFVIAIVLHYLPIEGPAIFALRSSMHMLVYFMLGVCCVDWGLSSIMNRMNTRAYQGICFMTVACFALISVLRFCFDFFVGGRLLPWLGIASVMVVSNFLAKYAKGRLLSLILTVSASNYIIYLFHTTFEGFAKALLQKLHVCVVNGDVTFIVEAVLVIFLGVVCPILLDVLILRKFKITKILFGLK